MTLFQHTLGQLLRGEKTETSRLALPLADGEHIVGREMIQYPSGVKSVMRGTDKGWRIKYQVGKEYAIQPARGVASIGRYRLVDIWWQDVRQLTWDQIEAEGFPNHVQFLNVWTKMHDLPAYEIWRDYRIPHGKYKSAVDFIESRPDERYQAWRMKIEVFWDTVDWDAPTVLALGIDHHQELIKALNAPVR